MAEGHAAGGLNYINNMEVTLACILMVFKSHCLFRALS